MAVNDLPRTEVVGFVVGTSCMNLDLVANLTFSDAVIESFPLYNTHNFRVDDPPTITGYHETDDDHDGHPEVHFSWSVTGHLDVHVPTGQALGGAGMDETLHDTDTGSFSDELSCFNYV